MIDEGYIKFESRWQCTDALTDPEIVELIRWRNLLFSAGLIGHYADINIGYGNISARVDTTNEFIISGTQTGHLSEVSNLHFARVTEFDIERNRVFSEGATEASSESMTHAALYQLDPGIRAVVHIHSDAMWLGLKDQAPTTNGDVAYGTPEMAAEFGRLFRETDFSTTGIAVMAGHGGGLISTGASVQEAAEKFLSRLDGF